MKRVLSTIAICGAMAMAAPAFAGSSGTSAANMTCQDFLAKDTAAQKQAVESVHGQKQSGEQTMSSEEESAANSSEGSMGDQVTAQDIRSECEGQPNTTVAEVVDNLKQDSTYN